MRWCLQNCLKRHVSNLLDAPAKVFDSGELQSSMHWSVQCRNALTKRGSYLSASKTTNTTDALIFSHVRTAPMDLKSSGATLRMVARGHQSNITPVWFTVQQLKHISRQSELCLGWPQCFKASRLCANSRLNAQTYFCSLLTEIDSRPVYRSR